MVTAINDLHGKLDVQLNHYYNRVFVKEDVEKNEFCYFIVFKTGTIL